MTFGFVRQRALLRRLAVNPSMEAQPRHPWRRWSAEQTPSAFPFASELSVGVINRQLSN